MWMEIGELVEGAEARIWFTKKRACLHKDNVYSMSTLSSLSYKTAVLTKRLIPKLSVPVSVQWDMLTQEGWKTQGFLDTQMTGLKPGHENKRLPIFCTFSCTYRVQRPVLDFELAINGKSLLSCRPISYCLKEALMQQRGKCKALIAPNGAYLVYLKETYKSILSQKIIAKSLELVTF